MNTELGPIRPEHACGGWRLDGDLDRWALTKPVGALIAKVYATTPTTVAWSVHRADGRMLRGASWDDVEEAKTLALNWIRKNQP